jgi:multidrug resistance efflux pump
MRLTQRKTIYQVPGNGNQKPVKSRKFVWGKFIYILIIIVILGIVAYFFAYDRFIYITGRGIVESRQVINIESPFISHIDEIFVDIGDEVNAGDNLVRLSSREGYEEIISAPFKGSVIDKYKNEDEVAAVKEKILLIANTEDAYILSFFEERDLKHINNEEPVKIIFENGDKLNGKIIKIYPGILPIPTQYQDLYGVKGSAGKRYIFAEVASSSGKYDMPIYYNMRLRIAISRWSKIVDSIVDIKNKLIG